MTVMGMAASQARFLGLTARKSNVEYQGQQINQQRTSLANESSNLYNQMMDLTVPTPPSTKDYYKTTYTLDDSKLNNSTSDCKLVNAIKNVYGSDSYTVKLEYSQDKPVGIAKTFQINSVSRELIDDNQEYSIRFNSGTIKYNASDVPYTTDSNGNTVQSIVKNRIYKVDDTVKGFDLSGYDEAKEALKKEGTYQDGDVLYFYQDSNNKNCFLTAQQLEAMTSNCFKNDQGADNGETTYIPENYFSAQLAYGITQSKTYSIDAQAILESSETGRYTSIIVQEGEGIPENLVGVPFSISTSQEVDQEAYDDAFNEYEYEKELYEQKVAELNAKTEVIQNQDKQLELRLQQLNTEQSAISTEMEAVEKVISDNVEKTFKIFA